MRTLTFSVLILLFHFGTATEVRALPIDSMPAPTHTGMDSRFVADAGYGMRAGMKSSRTVAAEKKATITEETQCGESGICYIRMHDKKTGITCYTSLSYGAGLPPSMALSCLKTH